ncbi:GntR family transcriptional regulator [Arthrobacter sp. NPDC090010]|uniref:GntR family transcriptional regulator n=1 Tax=Arthrobacter sp. NPDC090010 TaxID=3363942 RepID=UPI00380527A9
MLITVDVTSPVPVFEQLREQIAAQIMLGALPVGERLPPIRQLASDLALSPGTVARSYAALEAEGLIVTMRGQGTRVAAQAGPVDTGINAAAEAYLEAGRHAGLNLKELIALLRARHG